MAAKFTILKNDGLEVQGARIMWTNFSGAPTEFNRTGGQRYFNLALSPDIADELERMGWNIKRKEPRNPGDEPLCYTEIAVKFGGFKDPVIYLIKEEPRKRKIRMSEDTIGELDHMDFANIDLILNPHSYEARNPGGPTVKGYLDVMYVTQAVDRSFDGKYAEYEEDASNYGEEE